MGAWSDKGLSPFLTERARSRAPHILSYAASGGAALLISPRGDVALLEGAAPELNLERLARVTQGRCGCSVTVSFAWGSTCVYGIPIAMGWVLCVLPADGVHPGHVLERLRRASAVLALAFEDGGIPNAGNGGAPPEGGAPAHAFVPTARKN
jgi:hypothetical protein